MRVRTHNVLFVLIAFFNILIVMGLISYFLKISWDSILIVGIYFVSAIIVFYISIIIIRIIDRIVEKNKRIKECMNKEKGQLKLIFDITLSQNTELDWSTRTKIAEQILIKQNIEENKSIIKEDITSLKNQNINNKKLIIEYEKVLNNYKIKNGQPLSEKKEKLK